MNTIPLELWSLIANRHDMALYKSCIMVNKMASKAVIDIINTFPAYIAIDFKNAGRIKLECRNCNDNMDMDIFCDPFCDLVDTKTPNKKWIDEYFYKCKRRQKYESNNAKIAKEEILKVYHLMYEIGSGISACQIYAPLVLRELFDYDGKQICDTIEIAYDNGRRHFNLCYVKNNMQ